jgi:hypothetical protein
MPKILANHMDQSPMVCVKLPKSVLGLLVFSICYRGQGACLRNIVTKEGVSDLENSS